MDNNQPYTMLLKGGHVIDPKNNINQPMDVALLGARIAKLAPEISSAKSEQVIDVSGHYVTPGLIDIHTHVYHTRAPEGPPEGLSVIADHHSFRSGVTTMVDTGTAGAKHFLHFKRTVVDVAQTRILAFINIVKSGMLGDFEQDVNEMDAQHAASVVLAYPEQCVGIKTAHYWSTQVWDDEHPPWAAIDLALEASDICKKPLMVDFWPRPQRTYPELLAKMQAGDIHTHMYAQQFPVLNEKNKPNEFLFEARERGIIFDVGHGAGSFWFRQGIPAMRGGFGPDSISTDLHIGNVNGAVLDMITTMSKFLCMGMSINEVIFRSTVTPAIEIGRPELGTLSGGAEADIAVLQLHEGQFGYTDCGNAKFIGPQKLTCSMTIRAGNIVYDPEGLAMPLWEKASETYWKIQNPIF